MQKKFKNLNQQESVLFSLTNSEQVANICLNRPAVCNALDLETIVQLNNYFKQIANNLNVKILVLSANGEHFSSGADLNWMQKANQYTEEQNFQDASQLANMLFELYNLDKTVICAIKGNVYGGAMAMVACADLAIAAHNSKFCFPEVKLGLVPAIVSQFVLSSMNNNFAKYKMLMAKPFDVIQAHNFGLIHEVVDLSKLQEAIIDNINNLLSLNFESIVATKKLVRTFGHAVSWEKLEHSVKVIAKLRTSPQAQLLIKQFLEKHTK